MKDDDNEVRHESFGAIGAYHVSGDAQLFMSPHRHQHYVTIRITTASLHRRLSEDVMFGDRQIVAEVALSEAQWAHFVSSPNMGSGSPCTLRYMRDGGLKALQPPPEHAGNRETFSAEMRARAAQILAGVRSALGAMDRMISPNGIVSKAALRDVRRDLSMALANDIDGGLGFTMKQSEEWLDKMVESAKTEVEAAAMSGLRGLALEAISNAIDPDAKRRLLGSISTAADKPEGAS